MRTGPQAVSGSTPLASLEAGTRHFGRCVCRARSSPRSASRLALASHHGLGPYEAIGADNCTLEAQQEQQYQKTEYKKATQKVQRPK